MKFKKNVDFFLIYYKKEAMSQFPYPGAFPHDYKSKSFLICCTLVLKCL